MNVIIYSNNAKLIQHIIRLLSGQGFLVKSQQLYQVTTDLKKSRLVVVDISSLKTRLALPEAFCEKINRQNIPILLVLSYSQAYFLNTDQLQYSDFIFLEHIDHELGPRIRRILPNQAIGSPREVITIGGLSLNKDKYELSIENAPIELTYKEYQLLKLLVENKNKVFSRSKLLSVIWEYDYFGGSRTVDVHIRRLRAKLPPPYNLMLKTVRNVGYMFSPDLT